MPKGDKINRNETFATTAFSAAAIVGTIVLVYTLGLLNGRESERRQQAPAAYSDSAQADAQRSCGRREGAALFECVYERVEASQEQARGEQDLSAQQRAASAALASAVIALLTLVVSIIGIWFVKRTLEATLDAVKEAESGTEAALIAAKAGLEANAIGRAGTAQTKDLQQRATRAYISVFETEITEPLVQNGKVSAGIRYRNSGQSPAREVHHEIQVMVGVFIAPHPVTAQFISLNGGLPPVLEQPSTSVGDVGASDVSEGRAFCEENVPNNLAELIASGQAIIFLRGWVRYTDVFGDIHHTHFCWHRDRLAVQTGYSLLRSPFGNSVD